MNQLDNVRAIVAAFPAARVGPRGRGFDPRGRAVAAAVAFACTPLAAQSPAAQSPAAQPSPAAIVAAFAPHDVDGDGLPEVKALDLLADAGEPGRPLVVVLVEARLVRDPVPPAAAASAARAALRSRLDRFAADLAAEGHRALLVGADVHAGPPHQDGRTVLGLRRLLQRLHAVAPLNAAVLVGHFPDAMLVRTCNWRRNEPLSLPGPDGAAVAIAPTTTNVRCVPEIVAHRFDLVLADLDGAWEDVYLPGPAVLPAVTAVFGDAVPDAGGPVVAMQLGELAVVDVFHVRDGAAVVDRGAFAVALDAADRDHECTAADRTRGNPLALPEIAVSRIDARGIAWLPETDALEPASARLVPRVLTGAGGAPPPRVAWHADADRERQLLVDWFDRNHGFRTSPLPAGQRRPASIAHGLGSGMGALRAADPAWSSFGEPGYDVSDGADLLELLRWLERPAVLRTLRAHSDGGGAAFAPSDPAALQAALGAPWRWRNEGDRLVPSWEDHRGGRADFTFFCALHEAGVLPREPYLMLHTGCEVLSPPGSVVHPYDDPAYGRFAHAESILFFTPCLAIVGRAKVFYDEPRGFATALGAGETVGAAWRRYFEIESRAASWGEVGDDIGRKRAYFWSIVGDCTLRLPRS